MTDFGTKYFQKFKFEQKQIERYLQSAFHDLEIAKKDQFPEVRFTYSYQALVKVGIALIAKVGQVRVRSAPGHHIKILEKMSEILKNQDVLTIGNAMRTKRNYDFYGGGDSISGKEANDYLKFVEGIILAVRKVIQRTASKEELRNI
ncbi:MAG: hypothetical protein QME66_09320 [Candidatus Eisenbacteria bacterium]|nr:hypothetical protein [Candidatus Eisenbacteria bacterium]